MTHMADNDIWTEPRLSLVSRPEFVESVYLPVEWFVGDGLEPTPSDGEKLVEYAGRLCYMSQANPGRKLTTDYLSNILQQRHGSVFEHANYSMLFEGVSRSFTHELVRHRAGWAYSQLSQRYVDESATMFVAPPALLELGPTHPAWADWVASVRTARLIYIRLSNYLFDQYKHIEDRVHRRKTAREAARSVLPNATETKILATANARAWRTMLELRTSEGAEREMRRAAVMSLRVLQREAPGFFPDFEIYVAKDDAEAARVLHSKV
jgi:thymidylate synthase (FAD)